MAKLRIADPKEYPWRCGPCGRDGEPTLTIVADDGYGVLSIPESICGGDMAYFHQFVAAWNACAAAGIVNPDKLPEAIDLLKRLAAYKSGPTQSDRAEWIGKMLDMADDARAALAALREEQR